MGSIVKANVGELENIKRDGRIRMMRKEMVGCVHSVAGNNKSLFQFEDGLRKEIGSSSLVFLSSKEEVDMDEAISNSTKKITR